MNAASNNANRTTMRNSTPVTMAPPLPARGQPGRAGDSGNEATLGCQPIRCLCRGSATLLAELLAQRRPATGQPPGRVGGNHRGHIRGRVTTEVTGQATAHNTPSPCPINDTTARPDRAPDGGLVWLFRAASARSATASRTHPRPRYSRSCRCPPGDGPVVSEQPDAPLYLMKACARSAAITAAGLAMRKEMG